MSYVGVGIIVTITIVVHTRSADNWVAGARLLRLPDWPWLDRPVGIQNRGNPVDGPCGAPVPQGAV